MKIIHENMGILEQIIALAKFRWYLRLKVMVVDGEKNS